MRSNVFIKARENGKLVYQWEGHNTWTTNGRIYLAQMLGLATQSPDVPVLPASHLKHMQFGIGGQFATLAEIPVDVAAAYPAGFDPNATVGNTYRHDYNIDPAVGTLERPVRIVGGINPYATAAPTDVWLTFTTPPNFLITTPTSSTISIRCFLSAPSGDIAYAPFTSIPLTEAGLVVSGQADPNTPYNPVVSYVNFATLPLRSTTEAELEWVVGF